MATSSAERDAWTERREPATKRTHRNHPAPIELVRQHSLLTEAFMSLVRVSGGMLFAAGAVLALTGCETVTETVGNTFAAKLSGANEVPPADPDGVGTARTSINDATNQICTDLEVR